MKIVFAQGNPGARYARTRHNVGFIMLDYLAEFEGATWRHDTKFKADTAEILRNGEKVLLVKPHSFYNDTGQAARAIVDFYKVTVDEDVLVIHDELALPFGTIRVRQKGSDAGNNGIKSLNAHIGEEFWRVRIGIWNSQRDLMGDADFVLSKFTSDENDQLQKHTFPLVQELINAFIDTQLEPISHKLSVL